MAKNLKKANLLKLSKITTENGFKIDLGNYIYNPSYDHDYPSFTKLEKEDDNRKYYTRFKYFKYHNGEGMYFKETYSTKKNNDGNSWSITTDIKEIELKDSKRFSLKTLTELTEVIEIL